MENIEAMLCAYIEGDLDASGRAEIEKHLRDHPQHRKLIDELIATRDMVRTLPRVQAPSDVGESLRGQVERSILLDDGEPARDTSRLKINRWPQMMAVAAVFVLVCGLVIILIKTLLPTNKAPDYAQTAMSPNLKSQADTQKGWLQKEEHEPLASHQAMAGRRLGARATPPPAFDVATVRQRLATYGPNIQDQTGRTSPVYLVVDSSDPSAAKDKISKFLINDDIAWTAIPQAQAETVATATPALSPSTMPTAVYQATASNGGSSLDAERITAGASAAPGAGANDQHQEASPATTQPQLAQKEQGNSMFAGSGGGGGAYAAIAKQQPDSSSNDNKKTADDAQPTTRDQIKIPAYDNREEVTLGPATQRMDALHSAAHSTTEFDSAKGTNSSSIQDIYHLARRMTPKQAEDLRDMLAAQVGPVALYKDDSADRADAATRPAEFPFISKSDETASTQPADAPLAPGDAVQIGVSNFDLPAGTEPVQNLTVAADGTIAPAGITPQQVAGMKTQDVQTTVAKAYADAIPGADPHVNVQKAIKNTNTATHALVPDETARDQNGTDASAVDVMIVIRKTAGSPPAPVAPTATPSDAAGSAAPSTQPAGQ